MNELPTIDAERPWPGLLPFGEDSRMYFHGREAETDELFRLIEREPLTVLFGQSGLGKSSLLNAGVFPNLRRAGYLPVYLRLSLEARAPALIDQVWQALKSAMRQPRSERERSLTRRRLLAIPASARNPVPQSPWTAGCAGAGVRSV